MITIYHDGNDYDTVDNDDEVKNQNHHDDNRLMNDYFVAVEDNELNLPDSAQNLNTVTRILGVRLIRQSWGRTLLQEKPSGDILFVCSSGNTLLHPWPKTLVSYSWHGNLITHLVPNQT